MILFKKFKATWTDVGMDGYNLYLSRDGGSFDKYNDSLITETQIIIENIEFDPYEAKVTGVLGGEESELSDPVSFNSVPTFETDFSEYELDEPPFDWTERWSAGNFFVKDDVASNPLPSSDRTFHFNIAGSGRRMATWDLLDGVGDVEILALTRTVDFNGANTMRVYARTGFNGAENGYFTDIDTGAEEIDINKYDASGSTIGLGTASKTVDSNTWYYQKFRLEGNSLKLKVWEYGTSEPFAWDIEVTDSEFQTGWFGYGMFTDDDMYLAYFKVDVLTKPET